MGKQYGDNVVSAVNIPIILESDRFIPFMTGEYTKLVDEVIGLLMMFRNEGCSISEQDHSPEQIEAKLKKIFKKTKIDPNKVKKFGLSISQKTFTFERFKQEARHLYDMILGRAKWLCDGEDAKKAGSRSFESLFFKSSMKADCKVVQDFPYLSCSNLFPIATFDNKNLGFSILESATRKISSYEEIQTRRIEEKAKMDSHIAGLDKKDKDESGERLNGKLFGHISDFCNDMLEGSHFFDKFSPGNFRSSVKFFRRNLKALRQVLVTEGEPYVFKSDADVAAHKISTGYSHDFVNALFTKYRNLWEKNDLIPSQYEYRDREGKTRILEQCVMTCPLYVDFILLYFRFFRKQYVNISKYSDTQKSATLLFGDNFLSFSIREEDGEIKLYFSDPQHPTSADPVRATLAPNGYLNHLKIVDSNHKNCKYWISFHSARANDATEVIQTTYTGEVKQPSLRYDVEKGVLYIDLCISEIESENDVLKPKVKGKKIADVMNHTYHYFKASYAKGREDAKGQLLLDDFNVMGVDLGINKLATFAVYHVRKDAKGVNIGKAKVKYEPICDGVIDASQDDETNSLRRLSKHLNAVKTLLNHTRNHVAFIKDRRQGIDGHAVDIAYADLTYGQIIRNNTKFKNAQEYFDYVEKHLVDVDPKEWKPKRFGWCVTPLIRDAKRRVSKVRSRYHDAKDKIAYVRKDNRISTKDLLKIEVIKSLISLLNSYTFLGMTDEERDQYYEEHQSTCKSYNSWMNGIRNHVSKMLAAAIVHHALKNDVQVIFIEDLDLKPSFLKKKKQNRSSALLSSSHMIVFLEKFARKHSIVVSRVTPDMTSQIDAKTGELGYRDEKDKTKFHVKRNSKKTVIDADINAAHNIALRGILRHGNIPHFKVRSISDTEFIIDEFDEKDKNKSIQKQGALMFHLRKGDRNVVRSILFVKNGERHLDVKFLDPKVFKKMRQAATGKRRQVIRSGDKFYLRDELDKVVKQYAS